MTRKRKPTIQPMKAWALAFPMTGPNAKHDLGLTMAVYWDRRSAILDNPGYKENDAMIVPVVIKARDK